MGGKNSKDTSHHVSNEVNHAGTVVWWRLSGHAGIGWVDNDADLPILRRFAYMLHSTRTITHYILRTI